MSLILPIAFYTPTNSNPPEALGSGIYSIYTAPSTSILPDFNFLFGNISTIDSVSLSGFALLDATDEVDPTFKPGTFGTTGQIVHTAGISSNDIGDFRFVVGGDFTNIENRANTANIAVINLSSSGGFFSDNTFFTAGLPNDRVYTCYINDKIHIGGTFTKIGASPRSRFASYNLNGTLASNTANTNNTVTILKQDPNNPTQLYIGGSFTTVRGFTRRGITKIETTGSGGFTSFNANKIFINAIYVYDIEVMSDGRVIVASGGNSVTNKNLVRLSANTISTTTTYESFEDALTDRIISSAYSLKIDNNGKLLACFDSYTPFGPDSFADPIRLYRFNLGSSITVDTTFGSPNGYVTVGSGLVNGIRRRIFDISVDSNDNIILGGNFTDIAGISRNNYAVLDNDGAVINR